MTLVPIIDPLSCALHGDCADVAPQIFDIDGDVAEVIGTGPDETIVAAAKACPSTAISVVEATTRAQVYP